MKLSKQVKDIWLIPTLVLFASQPVCADESQNSSPKATEKNVGKALAKGVVKALEGADPFSIESGRIVFEGTVNRRKCRLSIDTGSATTLIDEAFAKDIGIGRGDRCANEFPSGVLRELTVGSTHLQHVDVQIVPSLPSETIALGMNVLRGSVIYLDFCKEKVIFSNIATATPDSTELAMAVYKRPYISGYVGANPCQFLVDLGSPANIMSEQKLNELIVADPKLSSDIRETSVRRQLITLTKKIENARWFMVPVKLQEMQLRVNMAVFQKNYGESAILGLNFFRQFRFLALDFLSGRLIVGSKMEAPDL